MKNEHDIKNVDDDIIRNIKNGNNLTSDFKSLDYSNNYIHTRIKHLIDIEYIMRVSWGTYELTEKGEDYYEKY